MEDSPVPDLPTIIDTTIRLRLAMDHLTAALTILKELAETNLLTSTLDRSIVRNESEVKGKKEEKMVETIPEWLINHPAVEIVPTRMPDLEVRDDPQVSLKHHCFKCLGEWIVTIPLADLESYVITRWCRWCESTVWHKPESAQRQREIRLRQQARKQGNGA